MRFDILNPFGVDHECYTQTDGICLTLLQASAYTLLCRTSKQQQNGLYVQKSEVFVDDDDVSKAADLSADGDEHLSFSLFC